MKLLTILLILLSTLLQGGGQPVTVPIQNQSFELVSSLGGSNSCGSFWLKADGWILGNDAKIFQPNNPNPCGIPLPPDGQKVLLLAGGVGASQVLSTSPAHFQTTNGTLVGGSAFDGVYELRFWVTNYYPGYPGYVSGTLSYRTQELCPFEIWVIHAWTQETFTCPSPIHLLYQSEPGGGVGQGDKSFVLSVSKPQGWILLFDNVSLTFTPVN